MNRSELLDKLAMELAEWPKDGLPLFWSSFFGRWFTAGMSEKAQSSSFSRSEYLKRRTELINCPPDSEAPEWAEWKSQNGDSEWWWHEGPPDRCSTLNEWDSVGKQVLASCGRLPRGHDWRTTLTRISRDDNTSTSEEEEEFARIQARQDAERPHEADARRLDEQLERDIATFREVYKIAEDECAELYGRDRQEPDAHYRHEYKGIKLDPYRIAKIYNMNGGPREQIMKKTLRFTDKGQTEQQVVNEIRSALDRWQQMLDEDQ